MPAVRKDVSVCTRLRVTTSPGSVSVRRAGEENSVTKVQPAHQQMVALSRQLVNKVVSDTLMLVQKEDHSSRIQGVTHFCIPKLNKMSS